MKRIRNWVEWQAIEHPILTMILLIAALISPILWLAIEDAKAWERFRVEHSCVVKGKMRGSMTVAPVISSNGQVSMVYVGEPDRVAWLCDDGVTYWR